MRWKRAGGGNAQVRLLIWQGTASLIAAEPSCLLPGYGPDTFRFVFPPFFPPELARVEQPGVTADRAHNDTLDTIVHTGLLGLAARLFFIVALLMMLLRAVVVRRPELAADDELIALALLSGITAHLAKIQVGIPTVATQLYFWMYAAIAVVVFVLVRLGGVDASVSRLRQRSTRTPSIFSSAAVPACRTHSTSTRRPRSTRARPMRLNLFSD